VTRPLRSAVGAHYGWKDFLVQRITAVVMVVYTLLLLGIALYGGGIDHAQWQALFGNGGFRIVTLLFGTSLAWHAWIGMRDIWMDYIKPTAARVTLEVLTVVVLAAYLAWLVQILWGRA
jgi:succinate dehydrogenase membrane anchor subunit